MGRYWRFAIALVLVGLLTISIINDRIPDWIALVYAVMGVASLIAYGADKRYAEAGQWRVKERSLLGTDLLFGIVGGLVGQAVFRHKTRKPRYVIATALIALVHFLWLGAFAAGLLDIRMI